MIKILFKIFATNLVPDYEHTLEVAPFLSNFSGDDNRFLCFGLPPSSDDDSEPLDSDDSEEPELDSSLLDEEEEVWVVLGDFAALVLFTANLGGIGICLALINKQQKYFTLSIFYTSIK